LLAVARAYQEATDFHRSTPEKILATAVQEKVKK
jgi:hypothetical protein